ncbi:OmpA family protein [Marinoscillum sp. MHG1-6]|uniref:OmpA family protein n=1 Tax=Marinoscillum sp. MHG1-6 TaxID=2959627 RepID=UPI00215711B7|nr:OmpA family protein [Marinoscillum sp. MHG1-6]
MYKCSTVVAAVFLCLSLQAQQSDESIIRVFGQVMSQKDSSTISASILYEKLPYYDDMGMSSSGQDGSFEFMLVQDTKYFFTVKNTEYNPAKLEQEISDPDGDGTFSFNIYLQPDQDKELITLENLIFARGSDKISAESHNGLDELVDWLNSRPSTIIQLEGHTDYAGNADANMKLSEARVEAVKEYLLDKGINKKRVFTKAFGGTQPLSTDRTPEAKAKNRRVEVRVLKK